MILARREDAEKLDANDPLKHVRDQFSLPHGVIYLDGNSLGAAPLSIFARMEQAVATEWAKGLIRSWNDADWIDLPKIAGAKIAKIIGAAPDEVIVADSVSVNIFKLASALLKKHGGALGVERKEFPTDGYILQGLSSLTGASLVEVAPGEDAFAQGIKILVKSVVDYRTAEVADIAGLETIAARNDAVIIWDLSHAAGLIDLNLKDTGARYAVGCGYKFLNGGPGAPAYIYVRCDCAENLDQPLAGWMGHAAPFEFSSAYKPASGVSRFACGTPPILSMSALDSALDIFKDLAMDEVETKARRLGDLFLSRCAEMGLETISPEAGARRGGHVSLKFENAYEVVQALIARGVIGDFRAPNIMRFGFAPLYLSYAEVFDAAIALRDVLETKDWERPEYAVRQAVT